jgi:Sulfotransferase family
MNNKEQSIASLATPVRPSGLIPLLERAPKSLYWKLIKGCWLLKREWGGLVHRLQNRRLVHFLHIPKTGGTAITTALSGHETSGDYELVIHDGHGVQLADIPLGEKIFFFMRDPISRFVSGFYGRQRQDFPRYDAPWDANEEAVFRRFNTPNDLALALSSDDRDLQLAAATALKSLLQIKMPLQTWLKSESYLRSRRYDILFIGFQESLNDDFELLRRILNLPGEVKLPEDQVAAHRNPAHVDRRLEAEAVRNLKIWYERDYRFFDICKDIAAQIRSEFEESSRNRAVREPAKTPVATS